MTAAVLRWLLALTLIVAGAPAAFAQASQPASAPSQLRQAEQDVRAIDKRADAELKPVDSALLRARLATARQSATAVGQQLSGELAALDARIAELGPPPAGMVEAPEVRKQRAALLAQRLSLDAAVKRARLLEIEAKQIGAEMQRTAAEQFVARISRRVASPVTPTFWIAILTSFDQDVARIGAFLSSAGRQVVANGSAKSAAFAVIGLLAAAALLWPGRRGALRLGQRYLISDAPGLRLRRSAYAVWAMLVGTLAPLLAAVAITVAGSLSGALTPRWTSFLQALIPVTGFAACVASVFGALLMRSQPNWRVAPIGDVVADRLRPLSWILAATSFAGGLITAFNAAVGASDAAVLGSKVLAGGGSLVLIAGALIALGRIRAAEAERDVEPTGNAGLGAFALVLWLVVLTSTAALLMGFVELSLFLVAMVVWAGVVGAATYLLANVIDDAAVGLFARGSRLGRTLIRGVGLRGSTVDQFGVLVSGVLRTFLYLTALVLLLVPFGPGTGVSSLFEKVSAAAAGFEIGGVAISPGLIVRGAAVLLLGLALVRWFTGWLDNRYLPATDLDGSGRNSVSLVARYVGIGLAVIWALASLGVGVEKIAILLSALSVGIGFGLQAITSNFISGLILLAERPIKIGDLIKVGNDEGDVKRISVRSTEIELGDHSTLIVPNSELITKSVLNKTLASPLGRVQITFSVPIEADAAVVERILAEAYAQEEAVLEAPAPSIFIDSIADGRIVFNSFAHVAGPRAAYGARSNVFKSVLRRLRDAGVNIGTVPQKFEFAASAVDVHGHADGPRSHG